MDPILSILDKDLETQLLAFIGREAPDFAHSVQSALDTEQDEGQARDDQTPRPLR